MPRHVLPSFLTLVVCGLLSAPAASQELQASFEQLTTEHGLPTNSVLDILQDSEGFLWMATEQGLCRYDGYEVKVYRHIAGVPHSLDGDGVLSLLEDASGMLWVGTTKGLHRYDRGRDRFERMGRPPVRLSWGHGIGTLYEDRSGRIWVTTSAASLYEFDRATGHFALRMDLSEAQSRIPWRWPIAEDAAGMLWVGAHNGLHRFDPATSDHERIRLPTDGKETRRAVAALQVDPMGRLWAGISSGMLVEIDPRTGALTSHAISRQARPLPSKAAADTLAGISAIHVARDGRLWLGRMVTPSAFDGAGLVRFDPETSIVETFPYGAVSPGGFSGNRVLAIHEDREGILWFATKFHGVNKLDLGRSKFASYAPASSLSWSYYVVRSVLHSRRNHLWIGTDGGLARLDLNNGSTGRYGSSPAELYGLTETPVNALLEGRDGSVWVGTFGDGLYAYRPPSRHADVPRLPSASYLADRRIESLFEDRSGALWVGTWEHGDRTSLARFNPATGAFEEFSSVHSDERHRPEITHATLEDARGNLWIAGSDGLYQLDPAAGLKPIPTSGRHVENGESPAFYALNLDNDDELWAATSHGLFRLDRATGTAVRADSTSEHLSDPMMGIVRDARGDLWISTLDHGIFRFRPGAGTVRWFDSSDGLPSPHFIRGAFARSTDGEIYFGSRRGLLHFQPHKVRDNQHVPAIVITGLDVFRSEDGVSSALALDDWGTPRIRLSHRNNDFAVSYAALSYRIPEKNRYAYILEGFDESWRDAGSRREAAYTNVPPGTYTFRVRGSNNDGIWNEAGAALTVIVTPPFWRTPWFGFLIVLLVSAVAAAAYSARIERLKRTQKQLEEKVQFRTRELLEQKKKSDVQAAELHRQADVLRVQTKKLEELDRAKAHFFANVSHEFRTPITLVLGSVRDLVEQRLGPINEQQEKDLTVIDRNVARLGRLIDRLLDIAKLESGHLRLTRKATDLVPLVRGVAEVHRAHAERQDVRLRFEADTAALTAAVDAARIEEVVTNLISNALKFTTAGGMVVVEVRREHGDGVIRVRDTGVGIPPEEQMRVFERFHQTSDAAASGQGLGIGLSLAKEVVELHEGSIHLDSAVGLGSIFSVHLPLAGADVRPTAGDGDQVRKEYAGDGRLDAAASLPSVGGVPVVASDDLVLIIEDNADLRTYLGRHLKERYTVIEAEDGTKGLKLARERVPSIVISDVMMPGPDGYEVCKQLKSDDRTSHIPVILLTARTSEESKLEGLDEGADDYIAKPFSMPELLTRVENLIASRRQLRERFSQRFVVEPSDIEVTSQDASFLDDLRRITEEEMGNSTFSVEELAARVHISPRQLRRRLKTLTGMSPNDFIRKLRLERAADLLRNEAGNVSDVAYAVGFRDPSSLSRLFHEAYGVPPSAFLRGERAEGL